MRTSDSTQVDGGQSSKSANMKSCMGIHNFLMARSSVLTTVASLLALASMPVLMTSAFTSSSNNHASVKFNTLSSSSSISSFKRSSFMDQCHNFHMDKSSSLDMMSKRTDSMQMGLFSPRRKYRGLGLSNPSPRRSRWGSILSVSIS